MHRTSLTITTTPRWWLKHYLFGVVLLAWLVCREPNYERVGYWVRKGIKVTVR